MHVYIIGLEENVRGNGRDSLPIGYTESASQG